MITCKNHLYKIIDHLVMTERSLRERVVTFLKVWHTKLEENLKLARAKYTRSGTIGDSKPKKGGDWQGTGEEKEMMRYGRDARCVQLNGPIAGGRGEGAQRRRGSFFASLKGPPFKATRGEKVLLFLVVVNTVRRSRSLDLSLSLFLFQPSCITFLKEKKGERKKGRRRDSLSFRSFLSSLWIYSRIYRSINGSTFLRCLVSGVTSFSRVSAWQSRARRYT